MPQKAVIIHVNVANDGDEFLWQNHLQSIANAADYETIETLGKYAQKPGILNKLKGLVNNPVVRTLANKL